MTAEIIHLAVGIVEGLNGRVFEMPFEARRTYRTTVDLETLKDLQVLVVPMSQEIEPEHRKADRFDCGINVVVQQKLAKAEADEVELELDGLMSLVQEIIDYLREARLESLPWATPLSIENDPVFEPEHLETKRVFTSVITLTYRTQKARA